MFYKQNSHVFLSWTINYNYKYYNFYFLFTKFAMLITYVIINTPGVKYSFKKKLLHS